MNDPVDPSQLEPKPVVAAGPLPVDRAELSGLDDPGTQALAEALRSSFRIVKLLMVVLVAVFFASGMFTVEPNQVAIILRFGKPVGMGAGQLLKPGWHWSFPYPIDEVVKIPTGQSHTVNSTTGWYAGTTPEMEARGEEPLPRPSLIPGVDGYTLTGDGNIIHVKTTLKYRIVDPVLYVFHFANTTNLLENILDDALIFASARSTADGALYKDSIGFSDLVLGRVKQRIEELQMGVELEPGEVRTTAPLDVRAAFNEVLNAQQKNRTTINEAEAYSLGLTNRAVAEATALYNDGLTSSNQVVQNVAAEARSFLDQLPYYQGNPELFQRRRLAETMQRILTNAQDKFFLPDRADGKPRELRLQLNREPQKPTIREGTPP